MTAGAERACPLPPTVTRPSGSKFTPVGIWTCVPEESCSERGPGPSEAGCLPGRQEPLPACILVFGSQGSLWSHPGKFARF